MNEVESRDESSGDENDYDEDSDKEATEDELNYASGEGNSDNDTATSDEDDYGHDDTFALYGVQEGPTLSHFANEDGTPAFGAYE